MTHRTVAAFVFACLLMHPGCDPENQGFNTPEPWYFDYHEHPLVLHCRTVNHALDTLGTTSVVLDAGAKFARRHTGEKLTRSEVIVIPPFDSMQLVYADSGVHTCSTTIAHYVGYQLEYGGDTTRYCEMDRYGPWYLQFSLNKSTAFFTSGESVRVERSIVDMVPDTVRPNGVLELDIVMDLDGLLVFRPSLERYYLNTDRIYITQR
ncbi:hypothetical protein JXB37_09050 [candidate division WOR-3 bacterium]|nr:hypothetical protein [candidate division WOR-3 bacterium]